MSTGRSCCFCTSAHKASISSGDAKSALWVVILRDESQELCISFASREAESGLEEYESAKWQPCCAKCRAQADPILYGMSGAVAVLQCLFLTPQKLQ